MEDAARARMWMRLCELGAVVHDTFFSLGLSPIRRCLGAGIRPEHIFEIDQVLVLLYPLICFSQAATLNDWRVVCGICYIVNRIVYTV